MPEISEQDFRALQDQVQALANQLNQARNRIEELEDFATDHIGLDWGESLVDANSSHPNISVNTAEYGGGVMRIDKSGQQIQTEGNNEAIALWFVPKLSTSPSGQTPQGYIAGTTDADTVTLKLLAKDGFGNLAQAYAYADDASDSSGFRSDVDNDDISTATWVTHKTVNGQTWGVLELLNTTLRLASFTSDPTGVVDGDVWYRSDTDKLYARINGATVELGGGSSMGVVLDARDWATSAGYDFWFVPGSGDLVTASSATNISGLDSYGWTTTNLSFGGGSGGDFLSSADHDPSYIDFGANGDILTGPDIFGSYAHMLQAAELLGSTPTTLVIEFYAAFTTNSANESTSGLGLGSGTIIIYSDGSNFVLTTTAGSDTGAAVDTAWHRFKIVVGATTEWFIDGVSQGTTTTQQDSWPMGLDVRTSTTNRIRLAWARVKYA